MAVLLELGRLDQQQAAAFAAMLIASVQGAMVVSRVEQSMEPFEVVCSQLNQQPKALLV